MKIVGINIDGVARNFVESFDSQYRKVFIYDENNLNLNIGDPDTVNLTEESFQRQELSEEEIEQMLEDRKEKERMLITLPVDTDDILNHYRFEAKEIKTQQFLEDGTIDDKPIIMTPQEVMDEFIYDMRPYQIFARAKEYDHACEMINRIQSYGYGKGLFKVILFSTVKSKGIPATYEFLSAHHCRAKNVMFLEEESQKWDFCDILIDSTPQAIQSCPQGKTIVRINREWNKWDQVDLSYDSLRDVFKNREEIFEPKEEKEGQV